MCFFLSHSFVALAVCFGSLSCWKTHQWPIFSVLAEVLVQEFTVNGPIHLPLNVVKSSCTLSRKTAPKHVSTSVLDCRDGVLGVIVSISLPPNTTSRVDGKELILVSSDHSTFFQAFSESFRCSLANFRWACTCDFLSRGTLRVLQDFNPLRRSVTNVLLGDCGPNCLEIINKLLPCSSGLIPHLSHDHSYPMWQDLARNSRPKPIDGCFVFLPFPNNRTNSRLLLTKLLADGLVAIPALCRSTILSLMSFDCSLVLPMVVERLEWKIQILWSFIHTSSWN